MRSVSEHDSPAQPANVMQDPDAQPASGDSQARQPGEAGTSAESESTRINGLMSTLGRRTNERDVAARERDQAIAERDEAQSALDAMMRQFVAQPSQDEVLAADESERNPPAPERRATLGDDNEWVDERGQTLMTEQQWAQANTFAPVTPRAPSAAAANSKQADISALDRAFRDVLKG